MFIAHDVLSTKPIYAERILLPYLFGKGPFSVKGVSDYFFLFPCCTEIPVLNAHSKDPDQTPRSAAFDLGLHCLSMSHL